jgi:hypothetical protein
MIRHDRHGGSQIDTVTLGPFFMEFLYVAPFTPPWLECHPLHRRVIQ